jgi:hypothetical protein
MNQSTLINRFLNQFLIAALLVSAPVLLAGPETYDTSKEAPPPPPQPWCETPAPLEVRIGLPGFLSSLGGGFGVKGIDLPLDVSISELLPHINQIPLVLSAYVRYHRWEIFGDGEYLGLGVNVQLPGLLFTNANLDIKNAFWEGFIGYRLINCQRASLSLYAGARYTYYSGALQIVNNKDPRFPVIRRKLGIPDSLFVTGSIDWTDPVVGLGGRVRIWKPVTLYANADVGGFDANSTSAFELTRKGPVPKSSDDWSYQLQGGVEFQVTRWLWTQVGWRYLSYDYTSGGFLNKTALNGPFINTGLNF